MTKNFLNMDSRDGGSSFINSVSNYLYNNIDILDFYSTFRSNFKSVLLILIYHGVGQNQENWMHPSINEKIFETQINYIKRRYKVISLKSLVSLNQEKKPLPKKAAIITFDDGYKNIYKYAYPILISLVAGRSPRKRRNLIDKLCRISIINICSIFQ